MYKPQSKFPAQPEIRTFINHQIRAAKVLCIDHLNINLGLLPLQEALNLARQVNLDLVQIVPPNRDKPPTCKIMDFGKYKYQLSKKKKESEKRQRENIIKIKEIKFRPGTDHHDLQIKARQAEQFLKEGCKVKISVTFKGREISHQEVAFQTLETFLGLVPSGYLENQPLLDNRNLTIIIVKKVG